MPRRRTLVEEELQRERIVLPVRQRGNGSRYGGGHLTRGQLYKILSNPIYVGRIPHKGDSHPGLHPAIVDQATWDQVQARLAANRQGERARVRAASPSLLAGKLVDEAGRSLVASHGNKGGRRYRYYVSGPCRTVAAGRAAALAKRALA